MKLATIVALIVGLALFTALITWQGVDTLSSSFAVAGWQTLWLPVYYVGPLALAGFAWWTLFARELAPRYGAALHATWIAFGVNALLPVAQLGGELVKARLVIKTGIPTATAMASVVIDKTVQAVTQLLYALLGLGLLAVYYSVDDIVLGAVIFSFFLGAGIYGFYRVQKAGLFAGLIAIFGRFAPAAARTDLDEGGRSIDAAIRTIYERREAVGRACVIRLVMRVASAGEVWLALTFLGYPVSLIEALIIESLAQSIRGAAFFIPGALGVQEGGIVLLGALLGIGPELALSLALCKRVRELAVGVPGLIAWKIAEGRDILRTVSRWRRASD